MQLSEWYFAAAEKTVKLRFRFHFLFCHLVWQWFNFTFVMAARIVVPTVGLCPGNSYPMDIPCKERSAIFPQGMHCTCSILPLLMGIAVPFNKLQAPSRQQNLIFQPRIAVCDIRTQLQSSCCYRSASVPP